MVVLCEIILPTAILVVSLSSLNTGQHSFGGVEYTFRLLDGLQEQPDLQLCEIL